LLRLSKRPDFDPLATFESPEATVSDYHFCIRTSGDPLQETVSVFFSPTIVFPDLCLWIYEYLSFVRRRARALHVFSAMMNASSLHNPYRRRSSFGHFTRP
jgi:hypothetical protein